MKDLQTNFHKTIQLAIIDFRPIFRLGMEAAIKHIELPMVQVSLAKHHESVDIDKLEKVDIYFLGISAITDAEVLIRIRLIRSKYKAAKIVLYGYRKSLSTLLPFFEENINGYLPEHFGLEELRQCLISLNDNKLYLDTGLVHELLIAKTSEKAVKSSTLSAMENEVAHYLMKGMSTSVIAKAMNRKMSTISTVKSNIFKKAKVDNVIDLSRVISLSQMSES